MLLTSHYSSFNYRTGKHSELSGKGPSAGTGILLPVKGSFLSGKDLSDGKSFSVPGKRLG
jgi:hypothetical protein